MHDPLVVLFEIKRPWPRTTKGKTTTRRYWPALITVWHREPNGHDSGTICARSSRTWHIHHWKVQICPLQKLRRWALTRCEWCGGRQRKHDPINVGSQWDGVRTRWWRGEADLRHHDCPTVWRVSCKCLCDVPDESQFRGGYGKCGRCGKFRPWNSPPTDAERLLATIEPGGRIPAAMLPRLEEMWDADRRARGETAPTKRPL
jgi:hypothetical protein